MTSAFQSTKQALAKATMLSHPHISAWTALKVDASDITIGRGRFGTTHQQSVTANCLL